MSAGAAATVSVGCWLVTLAVIKWVASMASVASAVESKSEEAAAGTCTGASPSLVFGGTVGAAAITPAAASLSAAASGAGAASASGAVGLAFLSPALHAGAWCAGSGLGGGEAVVPADKSDSHSGVGAGGERALAGGVEVASEGPEDACPAPCVLL